MGHQYPPVADQPHTYILTEANQIGLISDVKNMLITVNPFPANSYITAQAYHKLQKQSFKSKASPLQHLLLNCSAIQHTLVHLNKTERLRATYKDIKNAEPIDDNKC